MLVRISFRPPRLWRRVSWRHGKKRLSRPGRNQQPVRHRQEEVMSDGSNDGVPILLAFVAGAVVGAAMGLLFAPKAGAETRHQLAEFGRKTREKAESIADAARQKVSG